MAILWLLPGYSLDTPWVYYGCTLDRFYASNLPAVLFWSAVGNCVHRCWSSSFEVQGEFPFGSSRNPRPPQRSFPAPLHRSGQPRAPLVIPFLSCPQVRRELQLTLTTDYMGCDGCRGKLILHYRCKYPNIRIMC